MVAILGFAVYMKNQFKIKTSQTVWMSQKYIFVGLERLPRRELF